ncbi:MAG: hypothetical protein AAB253_06530, partial [candidate division NC10 bacterium]
MLRKRFCRRFDFELQAAATDDGIVLSLGEQHSFPLETIFGLISIDQLRDDLIQAVLASPMFTNRWRWNAARSLVLLRYNGGRRVPMPIQRMRAEDLLAAVFPAQLACQDNTIGPIDPPDHPLVNETIANCLHEAMDLEGLLAALAAIEAGGISTVTVDTPVPSPMSHEILNANPYAFLDDAPLEERRARAVALRRIDPDLARGVGALDQSAIDEVRAQAWPDVRDADELHDALLSLGILPIEAAREWTLWIEELFQDGRAVRATWVPSHFAPRTSHPAPRTSHSDLFEAFVATERVRVVRAAVPGVRFEPDLLPLPLAGGEAEDPDPGEATRTIVNGWLQVLGPTTAPEVARRLGEVLERLPHEVQHRLHVSGPAEDPDTAEHGGEHRVQSAR